MIFDPGKLICAVCGREVERLERVEDPLRRKVTFTAYCHGDVETVDIQERELEANAERIKFGRAFVRPRALTP